MTINKKIVPIAAGALLIMLVVLYLSFDRINIYVFAKTHNMAVSYKGLKNGGREGLLFEDLILLDIKSGVGIVSRKAKIRMKAFNIFAKEYGAEFDLSDGRFLKKIESGESFDTLTGLVSMPLNSEWTYNNMTGYIKSSGKTITIKNFTAKGDNIKVSVNGTIEEGGAIDSDITIYFSDKLIAKIPEALAKTILRDESGGWKSLSVALSGNYKAPLIQVTGKLFRLKIGPA